MELVTGYESRVAGLGVAGRSYIEARLTSTELLMESSVHTKQEIMKRLHQRTAGVHALGVRRLGLFGSFVQGTQHGESDVDVLVEFADEYLRHMLGEAGTNRRLTKAYR